VPPRECDRHPLYSKLPAATQNIAIAVVVARSPNLRLAEPMAVAGR
jgi:hypothetical protein